MATTYDATKDPYVSNGMGPSSFGKNASAVTPDNTNDFAAYPKAIMVVNSGNLVVLPLKAADDGSHTITLTGVSAGSVLPFRVRRVLATGTTATVVAIDD